MFEHNSQMLVESEQEFANVLDALLPEVHFVLKTD